MKKNVGGPDRLFRLGLGIFSLAILFVAQDTFLQLVFGIVAIIGLVTGTIGYCPINDKLGVDTTKKR